MIEWKKDEGPYANGENGFLGKAVIFSIHWDAFKQKGSDLPDYRLGCKLPGIKPSLGNYELDAAKDKAERVLKHWLSITGLEEVK